MQTVEIVLPKLKKWQQDVYDEVAHKGGSGMKFVLKSSRQKGKSILANVLLLTYAIEHKSTSVVVEPVMAQSRRMHKQLCDWLANTGIIKSANSTLLTIEFCNGSEILFKSAEMDDNLRGFTVSKNGLLVIDEGAFIKQSAYEILWPITEACQAPTLVISTPLFRDSEFYRLYTQGNSDEFPNVKSFDWQNYDMSELMPPEKVEYFRKTMSPIRFRSEILGEFIDDGSFIFGNFQKNYGYSQKPPKYAAIDWATGKNEKDDYSCLVLMDEDRVVVDIKFYRVIDPMALVDTLAGVINSTATLINVTVEENSLGEVYRSALKRKMLNKGILKSFLTTNDSKRRIIEQLIKAFAESDVTIPEDPRLKEQLQHYEIEQTPTGKVTYNAQSGFNDDAVIALALAYDAATKYKNKKAFEYALV